MNRSCGTQEERNAYKFGQESLKERGQLENVKVNGRIIIKLILIT
jgi:hypothetical protein